VEKDFKKGKRNEDLGKKTPETRIEKNLAVSGVP